MIARKQVEGVMPLFQAIDQLQRSKPDETQVLAGASWGDAQGLQQMKGRIGGDAIFSTNLDSFSANEYLLKPKRPTSMDKTPASRSRLFEVSLRTPPSQPVRAK
jgi:hypothetical protein